MRRHNGDAPSIAGGCEQRPHELMPRREAHPSPSRDLRGGSAKKTRHSVPLQPHPAERLVTTNYSSAFSGEILHKAIIPAETGAWLIKSSREYILRAFTGTPLRAQPWSQPRALSHADMGRELASGWEKKRVRA